LIVPKTSFFFQLVGTTYEYIWNSFSLNLEKAAKTNREPSDRKIQLSKKIFSVHRVQLTGKNSVLFQVQNQLLEVPVNTNTAFPTYLACTKLRTAGVNMQIPLTTTLINSWTDNKPYTFRRKPEQNGNKSGYHLSNK
jgi:hypothetical protein